MMSSSIFVGINMDPIFTTITPHEDTTVDWSVEMLGHDF